MHGNDLMHEGKQEVMVVDAPRVIRNKNHNGVPALHYSPFFVADLTP